MNWCFIHEKLNKTPEEVRELFGNPQGMYYDWETQTWSDEPTNNSFAIKTNPSRWGKLALDFLNHPEEYTNQLTMYSWEELYSFFNSKHTVYDLDQAGFLIDLAYRNSILIGEYLQDEIMKFRFKNSVVSFRMATHKEFSRLTIMDQCDPNIKRILNYYVRKGAYVRV